MNYTSLKLSKFLHDKGFKKNSELPTHEVFGEWEGGYSDGKQPLLEEYNKYDILNDLCVKYAEEIFGEKRITIHILELLQQNKKEEAEQYIMNNTIIIK